MNGSMFDAFIPKKEAELTADTAEEYDSNEIDIDNESIDTNVLLSDNDEALRKIALKAQQKQDKERNMGRSRLIEETLRKNDLSLQKTNDAWKSNLDSMKRISNHTVDQKLQSITGCDSKNNTMNLHNIITDLELVQNQQLDKEEACQDNKNSTNNTYDFYDKNDYTDLKDNKFKQTTEMNSTGYSEQINTKGKDSDDIIKAKKDIISRNSKSDVLFIIEE